MKSLDEFEVPKKGEISLCEIDGRLHTSPHHIANLKGFTNVLDNHPNVRISRDSFHQAKSSDEAKSLFLPVALPFLKELVQVYYEHGLMEALRRAATNPQYYILRKSASLVLTILNKLPVAAKPLDFLGNGKELIRQYALTRCWKNSVVLCLAWHPFCKRIAVATGDDTVRIYVRDNEPALLLKCKMQRNITCLAWRPLSNCEIAVGCEFGIFLWNVDPNSLVTRPTSSSAVVLQKIEHRPVISLSWGPRGDVLVSAAACHSTILIWDVEMQRTSAVQTPGSMGNSLVLWSPQGDKMFSASIGLIFRVWECQMWQSERWDVLKGHVQAACWSPCGSLLIFATSEEPVIYGLSFLNASLVFRSDTKSSPNHALPLYDLTKIDVDGATIGGLVQNLQWDPTGRTVAVLFQETNYIALFSAVMQPTFQLFPSSLIAGAPDEYPIVMDFQKKFEGGSCLTVAWSSGRLQHFPILYNDLESSVSSADRSMSTFRGRTFI